jgi:hypothetical protein
MPGDLFLIVVARVGVTDRCPSDPARLLPEPTVSFRELHHGIPDFLLAADITSDWLLRLSIEPGKSGVLQGKYDSGGSLTPR